MRAAGGFPTYDRSSRVDIDGGGAGGEGGMAGKASDGGMLPRSRRLMAQGTLGAPAHIAEPFPGWFPMYECIYELMYEGYTNRARGRVIYEPRSR